jgi:hypothetical protein
MQRVCITENLRFKLRMLGYPGDYGVNVCSGIIEFDGVCTMITSSSSAFSPPRKSALPAPILNWIVRPVDHVFGPLSVIILIGTMAESESIKPELPSILPVIYRPVVGRSTSLASVSKLGPDAQTTVSISSTLISSTD